MDNSTQHPWRALLLSPLSEEQTAQALAEDDSRWEYIDGQMVKLGSLTHGTLDFADLQQQILGLLSQQSKDFRLMVHLLRTLQHGGQPEDILLAVSLLTDYVRHFWTTAWPQNPVHKRRFAQQILRRFEGVSGLFSQRASGTQRSDVLGLLAHLAQVWHTGEAALAKDVDALQIRYARLPERPVEPQKPADNAPEEKGKPAAPAPVSPGLMLDHSSDKAWRQTLLKMADLLCELQPESAIGFRLRRYAIWHTLTTPPVAQAEGRTPLAAVSADRTTDYLSRMATPDLALWQQVEQSLTLAPYWLDGHRLSAQIASKLGYVSVAAAIRDELSAFIARLPALTTLFFTDMTPFLSVESADWLGPEAGHQGGRNMPEQDEIWQCYQQQGMEAALQLIDRHPQASEPRDRFYHQLRSAQLFEKAGLTALAQQQFYSLWRTGQHLQLSEWEPTLMTLLTEKQRSLKPQ